MSSNYVSVKYATIDDFMDSIGLSKTEQANISDAIRDRFTIWITEGNNNVEGAVSKLSDDTALVPTSEEAIFAKNAVIAWTLYKQRSFLGSANKKDAEKDYLTTIENMKNVLIKKRNTRTVTVSIKGASQKYDRILLPSQIDTQFY